MYAFIEAERETYGVAPICEVLAIAPSGYRAYRAQQQDPTKRCARAQRDETLREKIRRVWQDNHGVYGVRKVWHALRRDGHTCQGSPTLTQLAITQSYAPGLFDFLGASPPEGVGGGDAAGGGVRSLSSSRSR